MVLSPFSGSTGPKKSKKVDFDPKTVNFGVILTEISACGCLARPKVFFWSKKNYFLLPKKFSWCWADFGAPQPRKSPKKVDFGPKTLKFGVILAEISACGCPARPKIFFSAKIRYFVLPKKFSWCWHHFFKILKVWLNSDKFVNFDVDRNARVFSRTQPFWARSHLWYETDFYGKYPSTYVVFGKQIFFNKFCFFLPIWPEISATFVAKVENGPPKFSLFGT